MIYVACMLGMLAVAIVAVAVLSSFHHTPPRDYHVPRQDPDDGT